jgi:outer membrane receptor protein involved in Fe transport
MPAHAQQGVIEEIRVTGSYIKRDNFDSPSPVTVIDALDIEATGTTNTADIIFNMPQNLGTEVLANPGNATGPSSSSLRTSGQAQGGVGLANLRGLGPRATMNLMDGHRLLFGDANFVYPQIAIQRIEVLLDGGSALYGSEAIAGVVNYIPYKRFDGFKIQVERRDQFEASAPDDKVALLSGLDFDRGSFLFALEWRDREHLEQRNFPKYLNKSYEQNNAPNNGLGGAFLPRRNAAGAITNANTVAANQIRVPGCGFDFQNPGADPLLRGHDRWGIPSPNGRACGTNWSEWNDWNGELDQLHGYTRFEYQFTDNIRFETDVMFGRQEIITRAPPSPMVLNTPLRVPGDLAGNPYRAFSNTVPNTNFAAPQNFATSQLLYAQDNCNFLDCTSGDGFADRGYEGVAVPGLQGVWGAPVLLAPNQFAPREFDPTNPNAVVDPLNGGIAFYEDVTLNNWAIFGKNLAGLPGIVSADGSIPRRREAENLRLSSGITIDIPDTSWEVDITGIYGQRKQTYALAFGSPVNASAPLLQSSFFCINPADIAAGRCRQFNPFPTSQFQIVNRVPQPVLTDPGSPEYNTLAEVNPLLVFHDDVVDSTMKIIDMVASGNLWTLPAGEVGMATGFSFRRTDVETKPNALNLTGTQVYGTSIQPQDAYLQAMDYFVEFRVPVIDFDWSGFAELQLAARYTDNEAEAKQGLATDAAFDDTVTKLGLLWQPRDWLSVRASWNQGFVVPELADLFQGRREAARNGIDPTCSVIMPLELSGEVCNYATVSGLRVNSANNQLEAIQGNPDLDPESSTAVNFGFTLSLLDGDLSIQADYFTVDYDDVLFQLNFQNLASIEQVNFRSFYEGRCGASPTSDCAIQARTEWITTGLETERYTREIDPVSGLAIGQIRELRADFVNLLTQKVEAIDYAINYRFEAAQLPLIGGDWGVFNLRLQATQMRKYSFQLDPAAPIIDGVGNRNDTGAGSQIPPIPEWRGTANLGWLYGDHYARLTARYHSGVDDLNLDGTIRAANTRGKIDSSTYWDIFYSYTFQDLFSLKGETQVSLGIQNVFGHETRPIEDNNGIDTNLDNPLKQIWTMRLGHQF